MKNDLQIRTKQFALTIIDLVSKLPKTKVADVIGYQLLRSGTSIGANYREAARALSHDDFIHKIGICEKEAAETQYWLELLSESRVIDANSHKHVYVEVGELLAILVASGRTAKSRRRC
jgi:four helix bundle protein